GRVISRAISALSWPSVVMGAPRTSAHAAIARARYASRNIGNGLWRRFLWVLLGFGALPADLHPPAEVRRPRSFDAGDIGDVDGRLASCCRRAGLLVFDIDGGIGSEFEVSGLIQRDKSHCTASKRRAKR